MRYLKLLFTAALGAVLAAAQTPANSRDISGIWQGPYTPDVSKALGKDLPLTKFSVEQFRTVETADDPTSYCLPVGPARVIQAPFPFQIVQTADVVTLLFEYQRTFRIIYLDGRPHPKDFDPEWFGHSTGKWEGNALVVDTIGIDDRSWVDTAGHQHSDKFHLLERFEKTDANTMRWSVTFEDPVYYTEPFSIALPLKRQNTVIMSYSCEENNRDRVHLENSKKVKK